MGKLSKLPKLYLAVVFIILYTPIFYLIFYSFNSGGSMSGFESFTFEHYAAVFEDTRLIIILINTIVIALLSALVSTAIGVLGALAIVFIRNKTMRNAVLSLNNILIVSPDVIIGASFLNFIYNGRCKTWFCFGTYFTYRFQYSDCCYYGLAKIARNESIT